jgi:hypothetical protein
MDVKKKSLTEAYSEGALGLILLETLEKTGEQTTQDFKARIALIMRNAEQTGKRWSTVGASRANPSVLRKTTNQPTPTTKTNET